ncbi:hypothetical protein [Methyloterricola oryzae]|uniref:hypothetical protein n=1 Tax=Methyloterricola oryzae TaxID=1495050 RepID=UPI0005EAD0C9|nr:hypothetical protein [Methyloterricola oryzae]
MSYLNSERTRFQQQKQAAEARIAALQPQLSQLEQLRQQRSALNPALQQAQAAVAQSQGDFDAKQQQVADIEQSILDAQEPDQELPRRGGIPIRRISPVLQELKRKLVQAKAEANAAKVRLDQARAQLASVQAEAQRLDGLIAGIINSGLDSQLKLAQDDSALAGSQLAALEADLALLMQDPLDRPALEQIAGVWSDRAGELDLRIFDLEAQVYEMTRARAALVAEATAVQASLASAMEEFNSASAALADAESAYQELQNELNSIPDGGEIP